MTCNVFTLNKYNTKIAANDCFRYTELLYWNIYIAILSNSYEIKVLIVPLNFKFVLHQIFSNIIQSKNNCHKKEKKYLLTIWIFKKKEKPSHGYTEVLRLIINELTFELVPIETGKLKISWFVSIFSIYNFTQRYRAKFEKQNTFLFWEMIISHNINESQRNKKSPTGF